MVLNNTLVNSTSASVVHPFMNKYVVALVILLLGFAIGKLLGKLVEFLLHKIQINDKISKFTGHDILFEETIGYFISFVLYFIFLVWTLEEMGVIQNIISWLAFGIILIMLLSLIFSLRTLTLDFLSGAIIRGRNLLKKRQYVKIGSVEGMVLKVDVFDVILKSDDEVVRIPNYRALRSDIVRLKKVKI